MTLVRPDEEKVDRHDGASVVPSPSRASGAGGSDRGTNASFSGRTVEELAKTTHFAPEVLVLVLEDERERGHVSLVGEEWSVTPRFVAQFGRAFSFVDRPTEEEER